MRNPFGRRGGRGAAAAHPTDATPRRTRTPPPPPPHPTAPHAPRPRSRAVRCPRSRSPRPRCGGSPTWRSSLAPAASHRAHRAPCGPGGLAGRPRVHAGRAPVADAEPARVHPRRRRAARASVAAVGLVGAHHARGRAVRTACGRRAGRRPVRLAAHRTRPLLGGLGRALGPPRRQPVAGGPGAAPRLRRRRLAGDPARGGGQHRLRPSCGVGGCRTTDGAGRPRSVRPHHGHGLVGRRPPREQGTARIAVVQPGVYDGSGGAERRFARGEELTRELVGQDVDLVVWARAASAPI